MAYVIIATWHARPGREQDVVETITELTAASQNEPGWHFYQGQVSAETPGEFVIYEIYDDEAAAQAHSSSDHFRRFVLERARSSWRADSGRSWQRSSSGPRSRPGSSHP